MEGIKQTFRAMAIVVVSGISSAANLEIGEEINEVCAGCHGEYAEGGKEGEYPRLAGLPEKYIAEELRRFKSRERLNHPMIPYTKERELPEEDLLDVSAYLPTIQLYSKLPPIDEENFDAYERLLLSKKLLTIPRLEGDVNAGEKLYNQECASCHGRHGEGKPKKSIPLLTGQYSAYLLKQIFAYRDGNRVHDNEETNESLFNEYSEEDIHNLLAYLSILDDD
ncbi:MAG: c-type cytochrome [Gammaproteobacteria bacterium]|uniref:C-type cytochrome n=1 Tax=Candidatus Thiopontia autotrophica TaxID=2841688 RepID=A0A8J6P7T1_9GAMM|nr:c-type cytochrome [Candidatus Thiopontia autotrophica]MBL6969021.1 c-type cytochrome [Gammaproteobacteria bacterium]